MWVQKLQEEDLPNNLSNTSRYLKTIRGLHAPRMGSSVPHTPCNSTPRKFDSQTKLDCPLDQLSTAS